MDELSTKSLSFGYGRSSLLRISGCSRLRSARSYQVHSTALSRVWTSSSSPTTGCYASTPANDGGSTNGDWNASPTDASSSSRNDCATYGGSIHKYFERYENHQRNIWYSYVSCLLIFYSLYVIGLWAEASEDLEENAELFELASDVSDDFAEFYDGLESFVSTISMFYYAILLLSIGIFVISICQFLDKPWGTKALLSSTGFVLVLLLITGVYETSSFSQLSEDYEDLTGDEMEEITFFEVNGTIGAYCAGLCFVLYGLLAYIGRPKSPPVQLVMN